MGGVLEVEGPLHQLNRKRGTIIDDEDVAEELKARMKEKAKEVLEHGIDASWAPTG
jgi:hypothetical protein